MQTITKRLFSLAVAIVMVLAMLPGTLQASAEETEPIGHLPLCVCDGAYTGCTHDHEDGQWKPWDGKSNIGEGGNYYLTQDVTGSTQYWMGGAHNNTTEMTINLCTNGHSIDSNYRVFGIAPMVTFNLMNCSATESVLKGCASSGDTGAAIRVHAATSTLNIYENIRIEGKAMSGRVIPGGGAIVSVGTVNMYGGVLQGMKVGGALAKTTDGVTTYTAAGGEGSVLWLDSASSKFTMYGGEIHAVNCYTSGSNAVNADGTGFTGRTKGGAIWMKNGASFTMKGGEIYGSYVGDGGTVYANGDQTQFTMEGGTLYAGQAAFGGGAFKLEGSANFTMTGGLIEGNNPYVTETIKETKNNAGPAGGGAIMAHTGDVVLKGTAHIRNCSTSLAAGGGAIRLNAGSTLTLGGEIQVYENGVWTWASNNIRLEDSVKLTVDGLTSKARVGVSASYNGVFTTNTVSAEAAKAFSGDADYTGNSTSKTSIHTVSRNADGYMTIGMRDTSVHTDHCVCGGSDADCLGHSTLTNWQPWNGKTAITTSGNYYLSEAPEQGQKWLGTVSNAAANKDLVINLCLNGFAWYSGNRALGLGTGVTVNIMNCCETEGRLLGMGNGDQGGTIFAQNDVTLSIYDNVQVGSLKDYNSTCKYGGAIVLGAGSEFYMYGGRVTGRDVIQSGGGAILLEAGGVNTPGACFYMYDGIVNQGTSYGYHGGNIRAGSNCRVEILGGIVEGGKALPATTADPTNADQMDKCGGNIYFYDDRIDDLETVVIIGGDAIVRDGEGDRGGNIFQYSGHLVVKDNAVIEGGYARDLGWGNGDQNIHVNRGNSPTQTVEGVTSVNQKMACFVTVAGTPTIESIQFPDAMDATGLNAGAEIYVNRNGAGKITKEGVSEDVAACFTNINANYHLDQDAEGCVISVKHVYERESCEQTGVCSCGATTAATEHKFTTYVPNNDATVYADGTETAKCDNCSATHTRTVEGSKVPAAAMIGEELFATVEEAVEVAAGKTVKLLADFDGYVDLPAGAALDANGFLMDGTVTTSAEGYIVQKIGDVYTAVEIGDNVVYNEATGAMTNDILEAMQEAEGTETTLILLADVEDYSITVPTGVTLDLNGHVATFEYITAVGQVIDTMESGTLNVPQGQAILLGQGEYLPIWSEGGYTFLSAICLDDEAYTMYQLSEADKGQQLVFMPWLRTELRGLLGDGAENDGLKLKVRLSWNGANGPVTQDVNYGDNFVQAVYEECTKAFKLTISNAANLDGLTYTIVLVSDTGAEFTSQVISAN